MSEPADLPALLDALHAALRGGRFDDLAEIETAIRNACNRPLPVMDPLWAEQMRAKARRNDRLLAASLRGLRMAQRRIAELQAISAGYATYDDGGRVQHHRSLPPQLTRRF